MQPVKVNREIAEHLTHAREVVSICDDAGMVLGSFVPFGLPVSELEEPYVPLSREEVQRRISEGPLLTTAEVLAKLRSIE